MRIVNSNIVTAFSDAAIGAKVVGKAAFNTMLKEAVERHYFDGPVPGQAVIDLFNVLNSKFFREYPQVARECVLSGTGRKSRNPEDYVCRMHRGQVHMFLKRQRAAPIQSLRVVVYTVDAYLRDPDTLDDCEEIDRINGMKNALDPATHVLVAVLAGETEGFVSPYRFVANLAGGNLEYAEGVKSYSDLVALAKNVKEFDDTWATVAD